MDRSISCCRVILAGFFFFADAFCRGAASSAGAASVAFGSGAAGAAAAGGAEGGGAGAGAPCASATPDGKARRLAANAAKTKEDGLGIRNSGRKQYRMILLRPLPGAHRDFGVAQGHEPAVLDPAA